MSKEDMLKELIQNEIDWVVGDPTYENVDAVVRFFTGGGFHKLSDEKITELYKNLTA